MRRPDDASSDLAAVGDEEAGNVTAGIPRSRRRLQLDRFLTTEGQMPSTVRVSLGSMMPSSLTAPLATKASEPCSWVCSVISTSVLVLVEFDAFAGRLPRRTST